MSSKNRSIFATLPRTQRGMPLVLGGDPKGKNFLYTNGNSVIIRNIENPAISDIYTEHSTQTTVAKYSPSGFYICSADQSGKVRIWDTTQKEHILKNEFQPFIGTIKDLSWSPDNQRIIVVGEGRERFGHVFMAETGTSVGEIGGHSNLINSCDFRPTRPFRIITGSEDNSVGIYEGPPFKFKLTLNRCLIECRKELFTKICKRIPYDYPFHIVGKFFDFRDKSECIWNINRNSCLFKCPRDCRFTNFEYKIHKTPLLLNFNIVRGFFRNFSKIKNYRKQFSMMTIYFKDRELQICKLKPKFQPIELFSYIGGYIGIWLGISLIAICDFLEVIFVYIYHIARGKIPIEKKH